MEMLNNLLMIDKSIVLIDCRIIICMIIFKTISNMTVRESRHLFIQSWMLLVVDSLRVCTAYIMIVNCVMMSCYQIIVSLLNTYHQFAIHLVCV